MGVVLLESPRATKAATVAGAPAVRIHGVIPSLKVRRRLILPALLRL